MRIFGVESALLARQRPAACSLGASLVAAALLGSGCSAGNSKLQKEVESLQTQLAALQGDYDRVEERLMAVEQRQPVAGAAPAGRTIGAGSRQGTLQRPPLKIVRLANQDAAAAAAESADQVGEADEPVPPGALPEELERVRIVARGDKIYKTNVPASPKRAAKTAKPSKQ